MEAIFTLSLLVAMIAFPAALMMLFNEQGKKTSVVKMLLELSEKPPESKPKEKAPGTWKAALAIAVVAAAVAAVANPRQEKRAEPAVAAATKPANAAQPSGTIVGQSAQTPTTTPAAQKVVAENSIEATVKRALKSVSEVSADGPPDNRQISVRFMSQDAITVSGDMELIAMDMRSALRAIKDGGYLKGNATGRIIFFVEGKASGPGGKALAYKVWYPAIGVEMARLEEMNWRRMWEISDDVDVRPMMRETARDFCANRDNKRQTGKLCEGR